MKKPLILIMDDDTFVLEALESELGLAFSELFRIESFTDPREVLASAPAWEQDERAIALAIVDQKMPYLAGVDLLGQLRVMAVEKPEHPAAHMRAILLTGYAGLDSAIAAKNDASVDRYLEKPWSHASLIECARELLLGYTTGSGAGLHLVFREVLSRDELREHLALRFAVYRRTPDAAVVLPDTPCGLDMDAYDIVARFLSLFLVDAQSAVMIGTLRVAGEELGPVASYLEEIAAAEDEPLLERLHRVRPEPLPLMVYLVDREAVRSLLQDLSVRGERVVEPGRLTVDATRAQNLRGGGGQLARHIIESATAYVYFFLEIENAILTCIPLHVRFYRPLGCAETPGTQTQYQPNLGSVWACLHGLRTRVPPATRAVALSLAARIQRTGSTCRCAAFPACLPGPYETGNFSSVDVFCPARAAEVLASPEPRLNA